MGGKERGQERRKVVRGGERGEEQYKESLERRGGRRGEEKRGEMSANRKLHEGGEAPKP